MERKFLKDLGLEDEAITKIMAENGKDIQREQEGVDKLKQQVADYETQIHESNERLEALQEKAKGNEELEKALAEEAQKRQTENEANEAQKAKYEAEIEKRDRDAAIADIIRTYNPKNEKAILAYLDQDKIQFDTKTKTVSGVKEQMEELKKNEAYLLNDTQVKFDGVKPGEAGDPGKTEAVSAEDYYTDKFKK